MAQHSSRSLLIIDDDTVLRDLYRVKFERAGYKVSIAENGAKAIDFLKSGGRPDIILLDVMMPSMDGFDFLKEAKHKEIALPPIIMLTNQQDDMDRMKAYAYGAHHFILKALSTPKDVLTRVEELLKKQGARDTDFASL